jgi:hypothetical protein
MRKRRDGQQTLLTLGGEHLVLGITREAPVLPKVGLAAIRNQVIELFGTGQMHPGQRRCRSRPLR